MIDKQQIKSATAKAFKALANLMVPVVYEQVSTGAYDSATGQKSKTTIEHKLDAVVVSFSARQINGTTIQANDLQFIFEGDSVTFDLAVGEMILHEGKRYSVVSWEGDPVGATLTIQARR